MVDPKVLAKCHSIAEKFRALKGFKPGSLFAKEGGAKAGEGSLYIYQQIGMDWWTGDGITADSVRQALEQLKGVKTLNIYINSEGGDVFEAKAIYTQLQRFDAEKVVHIDGLAASAATFVAMAGDRIITSDVGTWMIHEAWGGVLGRATEMRAYADVLEMINDDIANLYAKQTGKSTEECLKLMAAETWMNAAQALELGLTDEVASPEMEEADAKAAAKTQRVVALAASTQRVLNGSAADLLEFRARRAGATTQAEPPPPPVRASPAKRASASR
jgi:ATP-dependent Clp protease protease subunit